MWYEYSAEHIEILLEHCREVGTLTAPVLDADQPTLLLQVTSSSAVTVTVGETNIVTDHTGTFQVGWYWDGEATRRYPAVEVA